MECRLTKHVQSKYLNIILYGRKTVEARNQSTEYHIPTPYYIKFQDGERTATAKVTEVIDYPNLSSFLAVHFKKAMPGPWNYTEKDALAEYLSIEHPKTHAKVFTESGPITALVFQLEDSFMAVAEGLESQIFELDAQISQLKEQKRKLEMLSKISSEKSEYTTCVVCHCVFQKQDWNTGPWGRLCDRHAD
jgi:ASC-1-like (ASCH) protein